MVAGRFATTFDDSLPGRFATWRLATWTIRHLDVSHLWMFWYEDVSLPPWTFRHLSQSL